jgi:hypothetical protein
VKRASVIIAVLAGLLSGCCAREPVTKYGVVATQDPRTKVRFIGLYRPSGYPVAVVYARGANGWAANGKLWSVRWPFHETIFGLESR